MEYIAEQTIRHGWQGRVAVGHLTELGALPPVEQDRIIAAIREAGIGVISVTAVWMWEVRRTSWSGTPSERRM